MRIVYLILAVLATVGIVCAHDNYVGRSGAPGRETCASSCHGITPPAGTVQISGFPLTYTPGQNYLLTIQRMSGGNIVNFNASCRVGTGTTNAGVITSGTGTSTYNTTGETNGVHFTSGNLVSGTFNWQAPAVGTGTVRLYAGALQSNIDGQNTTLVLVSDEAAALPGVAINPVPADHAAGQAVSVTATWMAGAGATSHDVYFGTTDPPAFIGNQAGLSYDPPGDLANGTTYFWRIDERNAAGVTAGTVWDFTTIDAAPPAAPERLVIQPLTPYVKLNWGPVVSATGYAVYRDVVPEVQVLPAFQIATTADTTYIDSAATAAKYFYMVTSSR